MQKMTKSDLQKVLVPFPEIQFDVQLACLLQLELNLKQITNSKSISVQSYSFWDAYLFLLLFASAFTCASKKFNAKKKLTELLTEQARENEDTALKKRKRTIIVMKRIILVLTTTSLL